MKVVYWGTYDTGKPRNRILIRGLRENGVEVTECHRNVWDGIEDKSQLRGYVGKLQALVKWLLSYPKLISDYLLLPTHDCTVIGYLGHLDVLVLWPFAKIKKQPLVWDAFISLYDTVVSDRKILSRYNPVSIALFFFEWLACQAADLVVLDTEAHAAYFREHYRLSVDACKSVFVGVETDQFPQVTAKKENGAGEKIFNILFYGQFIPLHGIDTIVHAAALLKDEQTIRWTLIGTGQEKKGIDTLVKELSLPQLNMREWVDYGELKACIQSADICLGIFGTSGKAARVIPNKVFQIVSCGKALITRDSPAIRELFQGEAEGVFLVDAGDPKCLAEKVMYLCRNKNIHQNEPFFSDMRQQISPAGVGRELRALLQTLL